MFIPGPYAKQRDMGGEKECQRRAEGRRERSRDWPPAPRDEMLLADRRGAAALQSNYTTPCHVPLPFGLHL